MLHEWSSNMHSTNSTARSVSIHTHGVRRAALKTNITIYTLIIVAILLLLMVLIWHTSTTHLVEKFDMPHVWEADFVRQQLGGLKFEVWVVVFVSVSRFDGEEESRTGTKMKRVVCDCR